MIYCVAFASFLAHLEALGFAPLGSTDTHLIFRRGDGAVLTIHRPNHRGDVTEAAVLGACYDAEVEPPRLDVHWCD